MKTDYRKYLESPEWQSFREKWFSHKGRQFCEFCKSIENLHIHHRRYSYRGESVLGKETRRDVLTLCQTCHFTWHKINGYKIITIGIIPRIKKLIRHGATREEAFTHFEKIKTKQLIARLIAEKRW